jgi:hypothetical protein
MGLASMKMDRKLITDLDIQALVDGEVDDRAAVYLLDALNKDPSLYNRYCQYLKQKSLLKSWWKDN